MKTGNYLLPYRFKMIGLVLLAASAVFGICVRFSGGTRVGAEVPGLGGRFVIPGLGEGLPVRFAVRTVELDATLLILGCMLSLLFVALSREKIENEYMAHIRACGSPCGSAVLY